MALKKTYGLEVLEGLKIPKNASVPSWVSASADQAKVFYSTTDNKLYVGVNDSFKAISLDSETVGSIAFFVATSLPAGWVQSNGTVLSRAAYPDLYAYASASGAIVTDTTWWNEWNAGGCAKFSTGNGSTDFRIPDLRGEFIKGWAAGRGIEVGREVGEWQADELQSHQHTFGFVPGYGTQVIGQGANPFWPVVAGTTTVAATGGTETRPRNVALHAAIKY
jgi:phage-related tail fiber protein